MKAESRKVIRRPPRLFEAVVERLLPHAFRETSWDSERYVSPRQYVREAVRAIPFVVVGQARRGSGPVRTAAQACALWIAFGSSADPLTPASVVVIPVALVVLALRDAYAYPRETSPSGAVLDSIVTGVCSLLTVSVARIVFQAQHPRRRTLSAGDAVPAGHAGASNPGSRPDAGLPAMFWPMAVVALIALMFDLPIRDLTTTLMVLFAVVCAPAKYRGRRRAEALARPSWSIAPRLASSRHVNRDVPYRIQHAAGDVHWEGGAKLMFVTFLVVPLVATLPAGLSGDGASVNLLQIATHLTAMLTLALLWRHARPTSPPA